MVGSVSTTAILQQHGSSDRSKSICSHDPVDSYFGWHPLLDVKDDNRVTRCLSSGTSTVWQSQKNVVHIRVGGVGGFPLAVETIDTARLPDNDSCGTGPDVIPSATSLIAGYLTYAKPNVTMKRCELFC